MPSRWLLLLALGLGVSAAACGPQKKYCVANHGACTTTNYFDAATPDEEEQSQDSGPVVINPNP